MRVINTHFYGIWKSPFNQRLLRCCLCGLGAKPHTIRGFIDRRAAAAAAAMCVFDLNLLRLFVFHLCYVIVEKSVCFALAAAVAIALAYGFFSRCQTTRRAQINITCRHNMQEKHT